MKSMLSFLFMGVVGAMLAGAESSNGTASDDQTSTVARTFTITQDMLRPGEMPAELWWGGHVSLSEEVRVWTELEVTSKGNGVLRAPGLALRVYDMHDNGIVYRGGLLRILYRDINNDGISELLIHGTASVCIDDEKPCGTVEDRPMLLIFEYDAPTRVFREVLADGFMDAVYMR